MPQSLKEVYGSMVQKDHEKVAAVRAAQGLPPVLDMSQVDPRLIKQAQDYDTIGRVLAHRAFADIVLEKLAEAGVPEDKKDAELERIMAQATGAAPKDDKKKDEDDKDKDKDKEGGEGEGEKKEAAKKMKVMKKKILAKMAQDPNYVSQLIAKYSH